MSRTLLDSDVLLDVLTEDPRWFDWSSGAFYIGAHAAAAGMTLLTRDEWRYRMYFPSLEIFAPPPSAP